jgi:hypothetical protein
VQIEQRIIVERSLLFAAFELRGCMSYVDSAEPQQLGRSKEDERKQKDKDIGNTYSSRDLPGAPHSLCNTNGVPKLLFLGWMSRRIVSSHKWTFARAGTCCLSLSTLTP